MRDTTSWSRYRPRALNLLDMGVVKSDGLVSGVWPLQDWQSAFAAVQSKGALKVLLAPRAHA